MNKCIILEGLDRSGKSTQIEKLLTYFAKQNIPAHVLHYSAIKGITSEQSKKYSKRLYDDMFKMIFQEDVKDRILILDRSHIGENVYAPLYRNTSGDWIYSIEQKWMNLYSEIWEKRVSLITLIDHARNLINRDDGLSFSTDIKKKEEEINRFITSTKMSYIKNKYIINIYGYNENMVFNIIKGYLGLED